MGPTSRMLSLTLGILLALTAVTVNRVGAWSQESTLRSGPQDQQTTPPDKKPDDKVPPVQVSDTGQPAQASGSGQPAAVSGSGQDQKVKATGNEDFARNPKKVVTKAKSKPQNELQQSTTKTAAASPSPIHKAAVQILDSLDVTLGIAQKRGTLSTGLPFGKQANDISVRRNELQQMAKAAKDDNAWADVASGAAAVLADALKLTEGNPPSVGAGGQPGSVQATTDHAAVPEADEHGPSSVSPQLPLYIAGLSLVFSVLGLGGGWLLTRREINKALIEAGLL